MDAPKTMTTTVKYRHSDGTEKTYEGQPCYFLSNSFRSAIDKVKDECKRIGEIFDASRIIPND